MIRVKQVKLDGASGPSVSGPSNGDDGPPVWLWVLIGCALVLSAVVGWLLINRVISCGCVIPRPAGVPRARLSGRLVRARRRWTARSALRFAEGTFRKRGRRRRKLSQDGSRARWPIEPINP